MSKLRVGIAGSGGIARAAHMRGWKAVADKCDVVACCDVDESRAKALATENNIPSTYTDYRVMLDKEKLDIVDICTPNMLHHPISVAASQAGAHVICEKPMAPGSKQVEEMIAAAKKAKKLIMCAQSTRFNGQAQTLKKVVDGGALGNIYYCRAQAIRRRFVPPRPGFIKKALSGGGPIYDIGVHILDLSYWLMGAPKPTTVTAMMGTFLAKREDITGMWGEWDRKMYDVEDFAVGMIRFDNGAALMLECSFLLNMKERERFATHLFGTEAGACYPDLEIYGERNRVIYDEKVSYVPELQGHVEEIKSFVDSVANNKPVSVPPEQTLQVIRMLEAMYKSAAKKGEVKL
jgi:predicted dehydrogenase